jgi:hypothetical protein
MKLKHMAALMREDITTVAVTFDLNDGRAPGVGARQYTYKVLLEDVQGPNALKGGDLVVVPRTAIDARKIKAGMAQDGGCAVQAEEGLSVARILEVHTVPQIDPDADYDYKWVVDRVRYDRYVKLVDNEAEMTRIITAAERDIRKNALIDQFKKTIGENPLLASKFAALAGPKKEG